MEEYEALQAVADLLASIVIDNMELEKDRPIPSAEDNDDWNTAA